MNLKKNPIQFLKQRKVDIPQDSEMIVETTETGISTINLISHDEPFGYKMSWNAKSGFNIESISQNNK